MSNTTEKPSKMQVNPMDMIRAQDAQSKAKFAALTSDGFENFCSRVGINTDNSLSEGTYDFNFVTRNPVVLEAAYRSSWVTGVVIDVVAEDMTRAGIDITTNDAEEEIKDFDAYISRMQVWNSTCAGIKWGRLYGGAVGVIQIEGQLLNTPLRLDAVQKDAFQGITIFDRRQINPVPGRFILSGPNMGLPAEYQIFLGPQNSTQQVAATQNQATINVHHSRLIRFLGIELPYFQAVTENYWGESVLERLWDRLISFDNATLSAASLVDRANLRTVGIDGFREILASGGPAVTSLYAMFDMMRRMQTNEGLTLLDKEDTFQTTAYSFSGLSDVVLQFAQQLSGASGIPLVRLLGQSPAGLNSTGDGDIRMYYDNIHSQQEARLRNPFDQLIRIMWRSRFGKPEPTDLEFTFTPLWQMSDLDKATIAKANTETILGAAEAQLISTPGAMQELRGLSKKTGLFGAITDEEIEEAKKIADEPPAPGELPLDPENQLTEPLKMPPGEKPKPLTAKVVPSLDRKPSAFERAIKWLMEN